MKNFYKLLKKYWGGVFILLLLNTPSVFAQSGFTLSWDSEVGCLEYESELQENQFEKGELRLYNLNGKLLDQRKIKDHQGSETFDLNNRATNNYVLVFFENGHRLGQQIIVKK